VRDIFQRFAAFGCNAQSLPRDFQEKLSLVLTE
jgi:hypothetical protein